MWKRIVDAWNGNATSPSTPGVNTYDFEGMKKVAMQHDPSTVLVDVREPSEFSVVHIPGSINVPYRSHTEGFSLDPVTFKQTFGYEKPPVSNHLIFYCASGRRGSMAREVAAKNGYTNLSEYPGSMNDWVAKGGDRLAL